MIFISGSQRQNCRAISSPTVLDSEYADSGRGGYSSSTGAYGGGVSNGRPSTVSLDAHTTLRTPKWRAAENTLYVLMVLLRNSSAPGCMPGAGTAPRWTTASMPWCRSSTWWRTSMAWPMSARSACTNGLRSSAGRTRSTLVTW